MNTENLKKKIYEKFETISEFAETAGFTKQFINTLLSGRKIPNAVHMKIFAETLGCTVDELY